MTVEVPGVRARNSDIDLVVVRSIRHLPAGMGAKELA